MSDESRKRQRPSHPTSMPPDVPLELDSSWDDDASPRLELDDPMSESAFDRVTAIPELPAEAFAKQVMQEQAASAPPDAVPKLASEPPVVSVRPLDPMGMKQAPRAGRAVSQADVDAARSSASAATSRPGRNRGPMGGEPTGLELADTNQPAPATSRSPSTLGLGRDPRDPMLELDLDLGEVARSGPPPPVLMPSAPASGRDIEITEMKDRYATGDFTGALIVAESLLEANANDTDAQRYAQSCRDVLTQMYTARLGDLTQRVRVAVPGDQIRWLSLDHRAGFLLSLIDSSSTVEELLDISGMNRLDALRILYTLYDQRVIALSER
ncbi:MAG TPA: hypothetical protein VJN18_20375 [Polyangiaceae bacterium]|nr:hypothetical protein [Polyangiaceae bacterium]